MVNCAVRAKGIAVLGTGSDVGKSLIAAGICRVLHRRGVHVAPFKAQNMSLNSFATPEGGEIGRAQALQAEACGLLPHVDMNPILLKPESDCRSQVIVLGQIYAKLDASAYFEERQELLRVVEASYTRLALTHDVVVIEGAGSAAEVNLRDRDVVNWPVARMADARVVLVADIDRGGVFAQIIGTLHLLEADERARVRGIIINKFRGDRRLFDDGVRFIESSTGVPVLGVVPFLRDLVLDQEDSVDMTRRGQVDFAPDRINIGVILLPRMSNFTDFNALAAEEDVALHYVASPSELNGADVIVIPGSKNTLADLAYLRQKGFAAACDDHVSSKKELIGICGGYQMLGRRITDPYGVEEGGAADGLGHLNLETELQKHKRAIQVEAHSVGRIGFDRTVLRGYQIRVGMTKSLNEQSCFSIRHASGEQEFEGAVSSDGLVWGTYIHGVFDQPAFRRQWLNAARARKGWPPLGVQVSERITGRLHGEIDRWTDHLHAHVNLEPLLQWS